MPRPATHPTTIRAGVPPMPTWLPKGRARREWRRIVKLLRVHGTLAETDVAILALYCQAYHQFAEASTILEREGYTVEYTGDRGGTVIRANPATTARDSAAKDIKACAEKLGMAPSSRTRVKRLADGEEAKGAEALLRRVK